MRTALAAIAALTLALAGTGPLRADDDRLVLYPSVWKAYQEYETLLRPGAFAVARDGSDYGYSYCPEARCAFNTSKKVALASCESGGADCVIFAVQRDIRVAYEVLDLETVGDCPRGPAPRVVILAEMPPPKYDFGLDIAALTAFERIGHAQAGAADFELLGLTVHDYDLSGVETPPADLREADGVVCAGLAPAELRMRMEATIYVALEFAPGTCMHRAVLDHEARHHEIARRLFTVFAAEATRYLAAELERRPFLQVSAPRLAEATARARVAAAIEAVSPAFAERYEREQGAIDTHAEYVRVANACPAAPQHLD